MPSLGEDKVEVSFLPEPEEDVLQGTAGALVCLQEDNPPHFLTGVLTVHSHCLTDLSLQHKMVIPL